MALTILGGDLKSAHLAAARELGDLHAPGTWLQFDFLDADGYGFRTWAWTSGGDQLGDRIDRLAEKRRLTALSVAGTAHLHLTHHDRGRVHVAAIALAPVFDTLRAGKRPSAAVVRAIREAGIDGAERARRGWQFALGPAWVKAYADVLNARTGG
jgi:hypothetical protein